MALELKGEQSLPVSQAALWQLLNDPEVLAKTIPGCNSGRKVADDRYEMGLKLQVANVSGEYIGSVAISEKREPEHYVLAAGWQGAVGFIKGFAAFDPDPPGQNATILKDPGPADADCGAAVMAPRSLAA